MTKFTRNIAIAVALLFASTGSADAGRVAKTSAKKAKPTAAQAKTAQTSTKQVKPASKSKPVGLKLSGAAAKSAVKKRRIRDGQSPNFKLQRTSVSPSGKTVHYSATTKGTNKVQRISVRKATKVTYKGQAPKIISEAQARKIANLQLRRENNGVNGAGTFSGVNSSGLTAKGNYKFTSATDANQFVYVNAKTGKVRNTDK